jgi:L-threonylcarbamoyladenylate synthase
LADQCRGAAAGKIAEMELESAFGEGSLKGEYPLVLGTFSEAELSEALEQAVGLLKKGGLIALPTETVYGLAADARNAQAVKNIYQVKGRPAFNPIIVHVASLEMAKKCVASWPLKAEKLARAFWPGPLSLVLKRSSLIPDVVTAGGDTVAVRWPAHPVFQEVIQRCAFPLAAPSANRSNSVSPTTAEHVRASLGGRIPLILDGGPCPVGIESTVLDLSSLGKPQILRPGMISKEMIDAVLEDELPFPSTSLCGKQDEQPNLKSPGQLPRHYSPEASLFLVSCENEEELLRFLEQRGLKPADVALVLIHLQVQGQYKLKFHLPKEPKAYAQQLYSTLHRCDAAECKAILVEPVPRTSQWEGVRDRLKRASAKAEGSQEGV